MLTPELDDPPKQPKPEFSSIPTQGAEILKKLERLDKWVPRRLESVVGTKRVQIPEVYRLTGTAVPESKLVPVTLGYNISAGWKRTEKTTKKGRLWAGQCKVCNSYTEQTTTWFHAGNPCPTCHPEKVQTPQKKYVKRPKGALWLAGHRPFKELYAFFAMNPIAARVEAQKNGYDWFTSTRSAMQHQPLWKPGRQQGLTPIPLPDPPEEDAHWFRPITSPRGWTSTGVQITHMDDLWEAYTPPRASNRALEALRDLADTLTDLDALAAVEEALSLLDPDATKTLTKPPTPTLIDLEM